MSPWRSDRLDRRPLCHTRTTTARAVTEPRAAPETVCDPPERTDTMQRRTTSVAGAYSDRFEEYFPGDEAVVEGRAEAERMLAE